VRPTAHELLESVRHSLREEVLPAVDDEWARYVAKCADKLLVAVQVRLALELEHLVVDTAETAALLAEVRAQLPETTETPELAEVHEALRRDVPVPVDPALVAGLAERAAAADEQARAALVALVDALYAVQERPLDDDLRARVEAAHDTVRAQLRRQLERDTALMAPTYMAFGDPQQARPSRGQP
jgi:hypothetical protein